MLRMGALAEGALSSTPRTSKAVTRLEKRGLVERISCAGDGRAINVRLTREGLRTYLRATPPHIELARDTLLADLSDEELTTLAELLERVTGRLDPS
jgi:DNA-binding MarR family transcriptional regulator